jgi:hypothetical protein
MVPLTTGIHVVYVVVGISVISFVGKAEV